MQCRLAKSIAACATLSLSNCANHPPLDSYCLIYNEVIKDKGDGNIVATPGVKDRLLANELTYRDQCGR
jgi:hypothetical protein